MAPRISLFMDQSAMVYFPGQTVSGRVKVESKKKIKCRSLSVAFHGFAAVSWKEKEKHNHDNNGAQNHYRHFSAQETYYEGRQQLWADPSQEIEAEVSEFAFTFVLPLNSPPSFVGAHGQVVHQLTVKLDSPKAFKDVTLVQPFSVNAVVDLNTNPSFRLPQVQTRSHTLGFWCCTNGPLGVEVRLDKSGYAPGEPIYINAEIHNSTKSSISKTKARFIMEVTYKAMGHAKLEQCVLTKISRGSVPKGEKGTWENEALLIPPLPPSQLPGCNIIDVCYQLQFIVSFKGVSSDFKLTFPINLGTIPIRESFPTAPEVPGMSAPSPYNPEASHSGGTKGWIPLPGLEQYPNIPPPTYQQAVAAPSAEGGQVAPYDVTDHDQPMPSTSGFAPYYVSYDRRAAPPPPGASAPSLEKAPIP